MHGHCRPAADERAALRARIACTGYEEKQRELEFDLRREEDRLKAAQEEQAQLRCGVHVCHSTMDCMEACIVQAVLDKKQICC
jgi:hypothetical protein